MRISRFIAVLAFASLASGCYVDISDPAGSTFDGTNVPVVGLSTDGLGYALKAKDFTSDQQYGPLLQTAAISVGTAVAGYTRGSAILEIRDATGSLVLQQSVTSNIAQGNSLVRGSPPFKVTLSFRGFSGTFTLGVGPGEAAR